MFPMKEFLMNKTLLGLAFALLFTTITVGEDEPAAKKRKGAAGRNNPAGNVLNQLKDVSLTDEQKAEIQKLAKKSAAEIQAANKEAGITPQIMKDRAAAQKELKDSGKKPAEIFAAVNEKLGLNEAQVAALKNSNEKRAALLKSAVALLTDDQKAKLPERLVRLTKAGNAKGKAKGKKKKSEDA